MFVKGRSDEPDEENTTDDVAMHFYGGKDNVSVIFNIVANLNLIALAQMNVDEQGNGIYSTGSYVGGDSSTNYMNFAGEMATGKTKKKKKLLFLHSFAGSEYSSIVSRKDSHVEYDSVASRKGSRDLQRTKKPL